MTDTTIWTGARIATMNPAQPWAEAIAVRNGVFVAVGSSTEVLEFAGPGATVRQLEGSLVLPGLVESHVHILLGAAMGSGAELQMSDSVDDILRTVRQFAADHPDRPAIFGASYNALLFDENGPSAAVLDQAVSDRPVVLMDHTLHGAWANSKALERAGVSADSPDPLPSRYVRGMDGTPTGAIKGSGASQPVLEAVGAINADTVRAALPNVLAALTRFGFTAAMDCGNVLVTEPAFDAIEQVHAEGQLRMRVSLTTMVNTPDSARTAIERHDRLSQRFQSDRQWSDTLKIITDSVLENQTAATLEPYCSTHGHGSLYFEPDTLRVLVRDATERGHGVILHAIGDRAVREGLDVAAELRRTDAESRFILTHCQLVAVEDRVRFAEHGVIVQTTANWANFQPSYVEHLGAERNDTLQFPFRSWVDSGATLALGADWPATPGGN